MFCFRVGQFLRPMRQGYRELRGNFLYAVTL